MTYQIAQNRLNQAQRSAIRAHAQDFVAKHGADHDVFDLEWSELRDLKADAKKAARDIIGEVRNTTTEAMATAIEAA